MTRASTMPLGPSPFRVEASPLPRAKFANPDITAAGEPRAHVPLIALDTLWFNTGTLCNLACSTCYIESSPTNDALVYITTGEVSRFLDEVAEGAFGAREIGFTGGEPFMNPAIVEMLELALGRGHEALVLTNAMRPMRRHELALVDLLERYDTRLTLRVSLDHYTASIHEAERGLRSWQPALDGLRWLSERRLLDRGCRASPRRRIGRRCPRRLCRALRRRGHRHRRSRSRAAGAIPGDGRGRRRAGDYDRLLGYPRQIPRQYHVRNQPDGRPPPR